MYNMKLILYIVGPGVARDYDHSILLTTSAVSIPRVRGLLAGRWESQVKHLTPSTGRFQVEAQD